MKYDIVFYDAHGKELNRVGSYSDRETAAQMGRAFLQIMDGAQSYKVVEYPA
jgi:hypothetical protein